MGYRVCDEAKQKSRCHERHRMSIRSIKCGQSSFTHHTVSFPAPPSIHTVHLNRSYTILSWFFPKKHENRSLLRALIFPRILPTILRSLHGVWVCQTHSVGLNSVRGNVEYRSWSRMNWNLVRVMIICASSSHQLACSITLSKDNRLGSVDKSSLKTEITECMGNALKYQD